MYSFDCNKKVLSWVRHRTGCKPGERTEKSERKHCWNDGLSLLSILETEDMSKLGKGYDSVKEEEALHFSQKREVLSGSRRRRSSLEAEEEGLIRNKKRQILSWTRRGRSCPEPEEADLLFIQKRKVLSGTRRGRSCLQPEAEGLVRNYKRQILSGARRGRFCTGAEVTVLLRSQKDMALPNPGSSSLKPEEAPRNPHGVTGSKEFRTFLFLRFRRWFRGESHHVTANMPLFHSSVFWRTAASKLDGCNIARFINTRSYTGKVVIDTDDGRLYWPYNYPSLTVGVHTEIELKWADKSNQHIQQRRRNCHSEWQSV